MKIEITEKEVEDIIFEGQLLEERGIKCVKRQVQMGNAGIVDILGYDRNRRCWVIIEIKRDSLNAKAYAQGVRYRNWLSQYLVERDGQRGMELDDAMRNLPYLLLIGKELSYDLRFLSTREKDDGFLGHECYLRFDVEPRLRLGSDYISNKYRWDMAECIFGNLIQEEEN